MPTNWTKYVLLYARIALASAFLSAVAWRFGIWQGHPGLSSFPKFIARTGQLTAFMPASTYPILAWAATICEISLALGLLAGFRLRWFAIGSAILLAIFGLTMIFADGLASPFDYSVFSASACALLLAHANPKTKDSVT